MASDDVRVVTAEAATHFLRAKTYPPAGTRVPRPAGRGRPLCPPGRAWLWGPGNASMGLLWAQRSARAVQPGGHVGHTTGSHAGERNHGGSSR